MYDGINSLASVIHRDFPHAVLVAGYANGSYAWTEAEWGLFPASAQVTISVTASADAGDVLDVENYDATPAQTQGWIRMRKASGYYRPTIYCSLDTVPAVRGGTGPYVLGKDYDLWVASYDGSTASPYTGSSVKQYESTANYDLNIVYDGGWPYRTSPVQPVKPSAGEVWPAGAVYSIADARTASGGVKALQQALDNADIHGARGLTVDGVFGTMTQTAVRNFEAATGLAVDSGIAGAGVRDKLIALGHLTNAGIPE
jgi:peptidoglycan hydrolase-like protein with peptidoglycan-binding domain